MKKYIITNSQISFSKKKKFSLQDEVFCDECEKPEMNQSLDDTTAPENLSLRKSPNDSTDYDMKSSFQAVNSNVTDKSSFPLIVSIKHYHFILKL